MVREVVVKSTPVSRWAFRYRKRYGYNFSGALILVGIIALFFGGLGVAIGMAFILVGAFVMWGHHDYHKKLKNKK